MTIKRTRELSALSKLYANKENETVVVYGDRDNNIHDLVMEFLEGKEFFYYLATNCSKEKQLDLFIKSINSQLKSNKITDATFADAINAMMAEKCEKRVIVIEEFQHILRLSDDFIKEIIKCCLDKWGNQPVLFILVSNNPYFVEHQMLEKLGEAAYELSGLIKIPDISFIELIKYFEKYSIEDAVSAYSILGGRSNYISHFGSKLSLKDNIINNILDKDCYLFKRGMNLLPEELREHNVYNTLLLTIAEGNEKLNDIHNKTGYSRAKISVYLNHLADFDIVCRLDSFDTEGRDNAMKGIYKIKDRFALFFYKFIMPNLSSLNTISPDIFYKEYISKELRKFSAFAFRNVCAEYLSLLNKMKKLPLFYTKSGIWAGKVGTIDILCQDDEGHSIIGYCCYDRDIMTYEDFEWLMFCAKQAKISDDIYYLFTKEGFDDRLKEYAANNNSIYLIDSSML